MSLLNDLRAATADLHRLAEDTHAIRLLLEALEPEAAALVRYRLESLAAKVDADEPVVVDIDYAAEWAKLEKQRAIARGERLPEEREDDDEINAK